MAALLFIFPAIYIISFAAALREVLKGNRAGIFVFLIFGLSLYTTAMSVTFMLGFKALIPIFQFFKEVLVLSVFMLNLVGLRYRPRFHLIDYLILCFFIYTVIFALLPIGEQSFVNRMLALKSMSFYIVVYFTGRLIDPRTVFVSKYLNYIVLLTIAAGAVVFVEVMMYRQLQLYTGYADYTYYFFNFEPAGQSGLSTTFDSDSGYRRFASFFSNPLEHAVSTILALSVILGLYTTDKNRFNINGIGLVALGAAILSILFALSRAPLISFVLMIYFYGLITKKKWITNTFHFGFVMVIVWLIYLFVQFENSHNDIVSLIMNTVDFTDPSSVGHIQQWLEGILSMIAHPFGIGIGTSGRVAGSLGENVGGENQYIIIGVQAGVICLVLYLTIYILFIRTGLKWLPKLLGKERKLCLTVLMLKIGLFIPLLTSEVESSSYLAFMNWFLSGLLMSVIMRQRESPQPQPQLVYAH